MTILKAGTPIGFQDKDGATLKVGDRIKNIHDASICVIDKFGKAVSPLGFKYDPASLNVSRGLQEDGNYFHASPTTPSPTNPHPRSRKARPYHPETTRRTWRPHPSSTR